MTSAINGRFIYKQGPRTWLDQNIRPNSLVFDLTNNILLYSPSGTTYYEFYPGQTSGGSVSALQWNNILNKPVASISTSGVLTNADWILFNGKADSSAVSNLSAIVSQLVATSGSGGVSAVTWNIVQNVPVASISTSGVLSISDYNKFNNKADVSAIPVMSNYYPISSTGNISGLTSPAQTQINTLSATVSQLVATSGSGISAVTWSIVQNVPVASVSTSGVLTSSDYNKFNNKADVSAIPATSAYLTSSIYTQNSRIYILNSATTNVSAQPVNSATSLPIFMTGYRSKYFYVSGTSAGSYSATIVFNGSKLDGVDWNEDNNVSATISNTNNFVDNVYVNNLMKWSGSMVVSGTIPSPGVIAYIEG